MLAMTTYPARSTGYWESLPAIQAATLRAWIMRHRGKLVETCRRLSAMGWDELWVRARQEAAKQWDAVTRIGTTFLTEDSDPSARSLGRFYFANQDLPQLLGLIR